MKSEEILTKESAACPKELSCIRKDVSEACHQMGFLEQDINALVLAIDEACTNIIRYAYKDCSDGTILIEIVKNETQAIFRLHDHAPKVSKDCLIAKKSDPLQPGGLGVALIQKVMDSVEFVDTDGCDENVLEMRKNLPQRKH
jgi:anti-sigma regulatory factor (Ser/Thr protein kinase)